MNQNFTNKIRYTSLFFLSLLASTTCEAWHGHGDGWNGNRHYHGNARGPYYDRGGYYEGGYYPRGGWAGPNIIINVPAERYYAPECQTVEECNSFGECWLQRYCD